MTLEEKKLKSFNLELALQGHPVCTRDGRKVTEIHYFKTLDDSYPPVISVINGIFYSYCKNGKFYFIEQLCELDLFLTSTKIKKWINIYKNENTYRIGCVYETKEEAIKNKTDRYIKTIAIEFDDDNTET